MNVTHGAAIACLAWAVVGCGRPNVEANCGTNGRGEARCDFTNDGAATGTMCAKLRVTDARGLGSPVISNLVCSGDVRPRETRNVAFQLDGIESLCGTTAAERERGIRQPWDRNCTVSTVPYRTAR